MSTHKPPETVDPEAYAPAVTQFIAEAEALDIVVIPAALANVPIGLRALRFLLALCNAGGPAFTLCGDSVTLDPADYAAYAANVGCSVRTLDEDMRAAKRANLVSVTTKSNGDHVYTCGTGSDDATQKPSKARRPATT